MDIDSILIAGVLVVGAIIYSTWRIKKLDNKVENNLQEIYTVIRENSHQSQNISNQLDRYIAMTKPQVEENRSDKLKRLLQEIVEVVNTNEEVKEEE